MDFLRIITSLFMALFLPIANLFGSLGEPPEADFADPEPVAKLERKADEFIMGENDIILYNGVGFEDAVEKIKALNGKEATVWLHEGTYNLSKTVSLSGIKNASFRAYPGEKVSVTAVKEIGGWEETTVNGVKAWVTDIDAGENFNSLFRGDEKLPLTRYPESGHLLVKAPDRSAALFDDETSPWPGYGYGDTAFYTNDDLKLGSFYNVNDVHIKLMHFWFCENTTLTSYENGRISIKMPCSMKIQENDRYFLENVFEALNAPGEWYHDTLKNKIYYIPQEGDDIGTTVLTFPTENLLFDIADCENINFSGLTVKNTDWCYLSPDPSTGWLSENGLLFPQGNLECNGVFDITRSGKINFTNCDFLNIGNGGIRFQRVCNNCTVTGCTFKEIGANAVFVNGNNTEDVSQQTYNIKVVDNLIAGYGRNFPSGIGILSTHARNCTYSHNEIHDGYYTAISCGWLWGYTYSVSDGNEISENLIYDIGQGWLSDMGGIYTLGIQPHTVLKHNKIYNVAADPGEGGYGGWGIYLDEGSSGITVYQNLVYDCGSNGFHQHYGKENIIKNNIFALSKNGEIQVSRNEEHNMLHLSNNIIVTNNTPAYRHVEKTKFTDDKNLYWDYTNGKYVMSSKNEDLKFNNVLHKPVMEAMGYYCNGEYEDPLFRDPMNFDFTLADNSPAFEKIGFEPWNYNTAGTLTQFD